ncbi:hypothetical protein ACEUZ9_002698 [Paracoccus litorisediminis]|uniref:hypothetical protein n=1 Tax=Paracoccus litorisediminis TaxID=2006130 RepID=UPI0037302D76
MPKRKAPKRPEPVVARVEPTMAGVRNGYLNFTARFAAMAEMVADLGRIMGDGEGLSEVNRRIRHGALQNMAQHLERADFELTQWAKEYDVLMDLASGDLVDDPDLGKVPRSWR